MTTMTTQDTWASMPSYRARLKFSPLALVLLFSLTAPLAFAPGVARAWDCRKASAWVFTEYPLPAAGHSEPDMITAGPDGNLWFTEAAGNKIARITTSGAITEYPVPTANGFPVGITFGLDFNLWFTEGGGNKIGRITTSGAITEYPVPTAASGLE